jgi:transcription elongation factor GreA
VNNKTQYISEDGLTKLRAELEELSINVRRQEIAQRIHDAKEHGDLAENAEYEDAKNEQAFVEGQIQRLEALVKNAVIIDGTHGTDHVQIGSTVKVDGSDGKETFTIVGSTEASPREGRISNESPVGEPCWASARASPSSSTSRPATSRTRSSKIS